MEFGSEIRSKMTTFVIGGFFLGVIVSTVWFLSIFETFLDVWLIDEIIAFTIFMIGVYLLEHQIGKISRIIKEELSKEKTGKT